MNYIVKTLGTKYSDCSTKSIEFMLSDLKLKRARLHFSGRGHDAKWDPKSELVPTAVFR